jgi:hypothetical protein
MLATDVLIASEGLFSEDALKDALLITIPTVGLTIATIWANDRLARIALAAIRALVPPAARKRGRRKSKPAPLVTEHVVHHGFEENHVEKNHDWDKELASLTKDNHKRNTLND